MLLQNFTNFSSGGQHKLGYQIGWQHLYDPKLCASSLIWNNFGHKLKSELSYTYLFNSADMKKLHSGHSFKYKLSLGGLHPNFSILKYLKKQISFGLFYRFSKWGSISSTFTSGKKLIFNL